MARRAMWVLAILFTGCYLPYRHFERASPPLTGVYYGSDGAPVGDAWIAVTGEWDDPHCRKASLRTKTDAQGRFALRGTTRVINGVWLLPAMERFWSWYRLCFGESDSVFHSAYEGQSSLSETAPGDSLECVQWEWNGRRRVTCSNPVDSKVVMGGRWNDGVAAGTYRLIKTEVGPTKGPDGKFMRPRLMVQWVQQGSGLRDSVRALVEMPTGKKFRGLQRLGAPWLREHEKGWCVTMASDRYSHLTPGVEFLVIRLGLPGDAQLVDSCGATLMPGPP